MLHIEPLKLKTKREDHSKKMTKKRMGYVEPENYFPKEIRKKYKLGEFAEDNETASKKPVKKNSKPSTAKKK